MIRVVNDSAGDPPTDSPGQARPAGIEELYATEYVPLARVAYLMVGSRAVAEELVQDAFAQVFERWHRIERPGAYLRQAVVNNCRSRLRRARLEHRHLATLRGGEVVDSTPEPLLVELGRLSSRQRAAIVMRFYLDASEAEIAAALGVRPGTVKSLLHRGLADLRKDLES